MKTRYIHISAILITLAGFTLISFLYWTEPKSLAEVSTKGSVAIGTYAVDQAAFDQGLANFRKDQFPDARVDFNRADPEKRDAATQFYIAYSYYRQGWGRLSSDDTLFEPGLEAANRVMTIDPNYRSSDNTLTRKTPAELKNELEEGLKITPSDFNPMKLTRERK